MNKKNSKNPIPTSKDFYDQYSDRFKDKLYADKYHYSVNTRFSSYFQIKDKISFREFLAGWITAVIEVHAINRALMMCPGKIIVDVPCGTGKLFPLFIKEKKIIIALDSSNAMVLKSKNIYSEDVHYALSDIRSLPIKDNSVDIVISNRFLHRISHEHYSETLCELFRISRKYAIFYFSVKNVFTDLIIYLEKFFNIGDRGTIYYISKNAIKKEVEKCGFHFIKGLWVFPFLSTGFLVLVKKKDLVKNESGN